MSVEEPSFVVRADQLPALYYLDRNHPRPERLEWINRGTDSKLRPSNVDMLLRTLFRGAGSPSLKKLHESAGLRAVFSNESQRERFARAFVDARRQLYSKSTHMVTAIFDNPEIAEKAVEELGKMGITDEAISLVWRTSQYLDTQYETADGHGYLGIASAMAGGGLAGAMLGTAILLIPGVGPVAVAGALTGSAFSSIATVTGIIGATGSGIAKMLTDHDVDGVSATLYEQEIRQGKVFVSVDCVEGGCDPDAIHAMMQKAGGETAGMNAGSLA